MSASTEKENLPSDNDGERSQPQPEKKKCSSCSTKGSFFNRFINSWLFNVILAGLVLLSIFWWQTRSLIPTGQKAPDFDLRLYQPDTEKPTDVKLSDLAGKKTILVFWAPWCSVCRAEVSTVNALKRILGDEANVYTVVLDYSSFSDIHAFITDLDLKAPVLLGTPEMARTYKINSFPTVYMLDADGKVINHTVGYSTQMGIRARLFAGELFN